MARSALTVAALVLALAFGSLPSSAATARLAAFEPPDLPEGLAVDGRGTAYVSIATSGEIRRVGPDGALSQWLKDELLQGDLQACPPMVLTSAVGANGLAFEPSGSLLVANTTKGQIVRVPLRPDGSAGTPIVAFGPDCTGLAGADGIVVDDNGNVFVVLNWQDRLVRINPAGEMRVLATKAEGLDFPASLTLDRGRLLLTNYAQVSYLRNQSPQPSLMAFDER